MVGMQWHYQGTKACIGDHFGLRVVYLQCSVLRVELRLRLLESGTRSDAGNHLDDISAGMAIPGCAIFRARCQGQEHAGIGREEAEGGRQDADHGSGNTVYTNLLSEHIGIGVELLTPKCVGKNGDMVGIGSGFFVCEGASDRWAEAKSREKIWRDAHGRLAFC